MRANDFLIHRPQGVIGQTELVRHITAKIGCHRIGRRDQLVEYGHAFGAAQVKTQAFLIAIVGVEKFRVLVGKKIGPDVPGEITARIGVFNLDQFRALVGQEHRPEGAGAILLNG
ncbi:hypothetical protein MnTg02_00462 [bacterium MnTg02]|nr:hypothetical protein MnTg02_00462 [bacterium MnTg02]